MPVVRVGRGGQAEAVNGLDMSGDFAGRAGAALVVGGSGGLGSVIAAELAARGSDVALTYRSNADAAAATADVVECCGRRCWTAAVDLSDDSSAAAAVEELAASAGGLHTLVYAAGPPRTATAPEPRRTGRDAGPARCRRGRLLRGDPRGVAASATSPRQHRGGDFGRHRAVPGARRPQRRPQGGGRGGCAGSGRGGGAFRRAGQQRGTGNAHRRNGPAAHGLGRPRRTGPSTQPGPTSRCKASAQLPTSPRQCAFWRRTGLATSPASTWPSMVATRPEHHRG